MATLSVLKFRAPDGADWALAVLQRLQQQQQQQLLQVMDAAVVTWPQDRKSPRTKR